MSQGGPSPSALVEQGGAGSPPYHATCLGAMPTLARTNYPHGHSETTQRDPADIPPTSRGHLLPGLRLGRGGLGSGAPGWHQGTTGGVHHCQGEQVLHGGEEGMGGPLPRWDWEAWKVQQEAAALAGGWVWGGGGVDLIHSACCLGWQFGMAAAMEPLGMVGLQWAPNDADFKGEGAGEREGGQVCCKVLAGWVLTPAVGSPTPEGLLQPMHGDLWRRAKVLGKWSRWHRTGSVKLHQALEQVLQGGPPPGWRSTLEAECVLAAVRQLGLS